jgi:hypothetical protein
MAIAFDTATMVNLDDAAVTSFSQAHTASGSNIVTLLALMGMSSSVVATAGGSAMTEIGTLFNNVSLWYFVAPGTGSVTYAANWSALGRGRAYIMGYNGVRQSSPVRTRYNATAFTTAPTVTVVDSVNLDMVVGALWNVTNSAPTVGAGQTSRGSNYGNDANFWGSVCDEPAIGASTVINYTLAGAADNWYLSAFSLVPAGGGNQMSWMFSRIREFYRELKVGRIPPDELRRRYGDLMAI